MSTFPRDSLISNTQLARSNNIQKYCGIALCLTQIGFKQIPSSYNNNSITKAMLYSQYIRNPANSHSVIYGGNNGPLNSNGNGTGGVSIFSRQTTIPY